MATQSQRSRKSAPAKRRARSQTASAFHKTLSSALEALWKNTDENGVRKGNGKQTVVIEALGVTPNQADHINKCLRHLDLLGWSGKGRSATYKVDKELAQITPEMAARAIEAVGPVPKAKPATATQRSRKQATKPSSTVTPSSSGQQPPVIGPDAPNNIDRLIEVNHRLNVALTQALEELERLRHDNGELIVQNEKLNGRLSHYEGGSSDIERQLAKSEELLGQLH